METHRVGLSKTHGSRHRLDDAWKKRCPLHKLQGRIDEPEGGRGARRGRHRGRLRRLYEVRLWTQRPRGQEFWTRQGERRWGLATGTQRALRELRVFRLQQSSRLEDLLAVGNGHA